ncbi:hypothetical protein SBV1_950040 [Verrucomicrobia bacterium]|nr:hypothetical protein SBV1_950040 [Verrucomicrobiota bacterium]
MTPLRRAYGGAGLPSLSYSKAGAPYLEFGRRC